MATTTVLVFNTVHVIVRQRPFISCGDITLFSWVNSKQEKGSKYTHAPIAFPTHTG